MKNQITVLNFENNEIQTLIIGGEIFFRATQLAEMLEYVNPHDAIKTHVDLDDLAKHEVIDSRGRRQLANFVNESGMYSLVLGSKQEKAKKVKRWVTNEVLPSIRKTGSYSVTINAEQQYLIQKAVNEKSFETGIHYGTIYTMIHDEFRIPRYEELLAIDFDKAITFIRGVGRAIGNKSNIANAPENINSSRAFALALMTNGARRYDEITRAYTLLKNKLQKITEQIDEVDRIIRHIDNNDGAVHDGFAEARIYLFLDESIRKASIPIAQKLYKPLDFTNI